MLAPLRMLKDGTADLHVEAERHVRILDPDATETTYVRYLGRMHGFHAGIERAFAAHAELTMAGFDPARRVKRHWLARDLAVFGRDASMLERCTDLPSLGDLPRAVGMAYVVEGSTLGGKFIMARMRPRLGHLLGVATRFLEGYRDDTGAMWRAFGELATCALVDDRAIASAVEGARGCFAALIDWLAEPAREATQRLRRELRA